MKRVVVFIFVALSLAGMLSAAAMTQETGVPSDFASDGALYVHALCQSEDSEAWQKWQSAHNEDFQEVDPREKYFFLPSSVQDFSIDVYNGYDSEVTLNGVKIAPHATQAVPYEAGAAYSVDAEGESYTLVMMRSNAEAAIYINNPDVNGSGLDLMRYLSQTKSRKAAATGAIVTPDGGIDHTRIRKMKGRGNTSWEKPKKSYNITYAGKVGIAGMDAGRTFTILANYQDDSLSRNRILYDLSDAVGMPYAPDSRYVDLYVNGFYWGSYLLCEKIEPGSLLPTVDTGDYLNADGTLKEDFDFVVEVDPSAGNDDNWITVNDLKITINSPKLEQDEPGYDAVRAYVKDKFEIFYTATDSSGDLAGVADIESLAKLYLINELGKNWDSGAASTFFNYRRDESGVYRFYGSPVWDYDNSMGNATGVKDDLLATGVTDYEEYTGWWCRYKELSDIGDEGSGNIITRIARHPDVQAVLPAIWFEDFVPALEHLAGNKYEAQIDTELKSREEYAALISGSAKMNYTSGWLLNTGAWIADHSRLNKAIYDTSARKMKIDTAATTYGQTFEDMYNYAIDWTLSRAAWLSEQFAQDY